MTQKSFLFESEAQTRAFAQRLAELCKQGIIFLVGELGAGKTTFSQAFIKAAGFEGKVKSPTYTLVEPYELVDRNIYHFDLYRLQDEEELLFLGCDDYLEAATKHDANNNNLCLIEWPEKASSILPRADIELRIEHVHTLTDASQTVQSQADINSFRKVSVLPTSEYGAKVLEAIQQEFQSLDCV